MHYHLNSAEHAHTTHNCLPQASQQEDSPTQCQHNLPYFNAYRLAVVRTYCILPIIKCYIAIPGRKTPTTLRPYCLPFTFDVNVLLCAHSCGSHCARWASSEHATASQDHTASAELWAQRPGERPKREITVCGRRTGRWSRDRFPRHKVFGRLGRSLPAGRVHHPTT